MKKKYKPTKKMYNPLFYHLGNFLMGFALFSIILLFWPIVQIYLFPPHLGSTLPTVGYYITIPKIQAQAKIIPNVNPFDYTAYHKALAQGVAQAKDAPLFFFAHSSGPPWEINRYNTIFLRIGELQKNDQIIITKDKEVHRYLVQTHKIVWPNQVEFLRNNTKDQLILQTCYPIGTSLQRLLVFAKPM